MRRSIPSFLILFAACAGVEEATYVGTITRVECPTDGGACVTSIERDVHATRVAESAVVVDGQCPAQLELYSPNGFKVTQDECYNSGEGTISPCRLQIVTRAASASVHVETHYDGARACR